MLSRAIAFLALVSTAMAACVPSTLIPGGCQLQGGAGVDVHYALAPETLTMALKARTPGYVAVSFSPKGQAAMFPADAVVGWTGPATTSVVAYQINGYLPMEVIASGVRLTDSSVVQDAEGWTTVKFTRRLDAGRFPLSDLSDVSMNVAQGDTDGLTQHTQAATLRVNFIDGFPRPDPPPVAGNATAESALAFVFACTAAIVGMYALV
jgi:DOMON domain